MISIGTGGITSAIKDIADISEKVSVNLRQWRVRRAIAKKYDEMLRNPKWPYRSTSVFGKVVGDRTSDLSVTRAMLAGLITEGVVGSTGANEVWVKRDNWELDEHGAIVRDADNRGVLRPGITPGTL